MSTKTVNAKMGTSPFDGLSMVDGVIIQNKCTPIQQEQQNAEPKAEDSVKKAPAKKAAPKKAETKPVEKQEQPKVKVETFEEIAAKISSKEKELAEREEALKKAEEENEKKKQLLEQGVQMLQNYKEKGNETMSEEKETKKNETVTAASVDDALSMIEKKRKENAEWLQQVTVKVETEDCWTQTKKGFCMGAGAAAGAGLVLGGIQLILSLCGGGGDAN